ncbi:MAG: Holliday junction resolvase RuvX [Prevotellaceae bacterium]|nr:Holliday junction resolvase RuvX [Prevotellaceae bacterium]
MGRLLGIDYGAKRVGIAATDELQIAANALDTLPPAAALAFLQRYAATHEVEAVVVGMPVNLDGQPSDAAAGARNFAARLKKLLPDVEVDTFDERFTSKLAMQAIIQAGVKKMARRNKALVDKVSACIMLQSYMEHREMIVNQKKVHD